MDWLTPAEREWEDCYAQARRFYQRYGDLSVPPTYRTETGLELGRWIERQRTARNTLKTTGANGNQIARLTEIGMTWDKPSRPQPLDRAARAG